MKKNGEATPKTHLFVEVYIANSTYFTHDSKTFHSARDWNEHLKFSSSSPNQQIRAAYCALIKQVQ